MEIVIETNRSLVVERRGKIAADWCPACAEMVAWVTPEETVILAGISSRAVYQMVETNRVHFTETSEGFLLVCLKSLPVSWRQSSKILWPLSEKPSEILPKENELRAQPGLCPQPSGQPEPSKTLCGPDCQPPYQVRKRSAWELTPETFASLLQCLDTDAERAAEKYVALRERLAKFFECRGCNATLDLADETINRVARRLNEGETIRATDPTPYFYGVARNVLREDQKNRNRQFLPLDELTPPQHPRMDPSETDDQEAERQRLDRLLDCLETCLEELPKETCQLLLDYHRDEKRARIKRRKEMAEQMGITVNALKIRVHRLRTTLGRRIRARLEQKTV